MQLFIKLINAFDYSITTTSASSLNKLWSNPITFYQLIERIELQELVRY